jgi:DNA polymerase-3 subunit beta
MKIVINRDAVIEPLQLVAGVIERKQTVPILSNLLFICDGEEAEIVGTDTEVEMRARIPLVSGESGSFTLPAKKFSEICKTVSDGQEISVDVGADRAKVVAGKSRFTLGVLDSSDFPSLETTAPINRLAIEESTLKRMVDKTHFAMAIQDVRYYLNGMLVDIQDTVVATVATDGHRLAANRTEVESETPGQILIPRKAVLEITRLLKDRKEMVTVDITTTHVRLQIGSVTFISKLIDGRYPDYNRVIPREMGEVITADRESLRQALIRTSILSNEKFKGINIEITENNMKLLAHNPEQEEAEEEVEVEYTGDRLSVGFNVGYMIEVLGAVEEDKVHLWIADSQSSCLIKGFNNEDSLYVIMPMRV